jgi:hypothetical protein
MVISPSGESLAVTPYGANLQYDRDGGLGTAVGTFMAPEPGSYQVSSGAVHTPAILAVGPDIGGFLVDAMARAGLICGLALAGALAIAAATSAAVKR